MFDPKLFGEMSIDDGKQTITISLEAWEELMKDLRANSRGEPPPPDEVAEALDAFASELEDEINWDLHSRAVKTRKSIVLQIIKAYQEHDALTAPGMKWRAIDSTGMPELIPCRLCGLPMKHIESMARSFNPPRLYHEYHHPQGCCALSGKRWDFNEDKEKRAGFIANWNVSAAPPAALKPVCQRCSGTGKWGSSEAPDLYDCEDCKSPALDVAKLAEIIHYPDCWDTAAYPAITDALVETLGNYFQCNEDHCPQAAAITGKGE